MNSKKTIIWSICAVVLLVAVSFAVWLIIGNPDSVGTNNGEIDEITYEPPITDIVIPEPESTTLRIITTTTTEPAPETTTLSEAEIYIEDFLAEASTYSQTVEVTTTPPGEKTFFHIVTDGTVTDDNSLEGLEEPIKTVGKVVLAAGFRYDKEQGIFYSESESWQRNFGYGAFYDAAAAFTGMYYDTMRLKFNYGGYDWMYQIWKGRYGITTGAEMGVYYKSPEADAEFYACVPDEKMITMSYALYRGDELYMTRGPEPHWWLTGFRLFDMIDPNELTLHCTFFMEESGMADALEEALLDLGFIEGINYQRLGLTMTFIWN